jgi:hypothetical protein
MDKFNLATSNAAETLGGAFLDGFKSIAGNGDIDRATSKIDKFSKGLAGVIRVLTGVNSLEAMLKDVEWTGFLGLVPVAPKIAGAQSPGERKAIDAAAKKAEEQRLKLMREQAKAQAKILADKKLSAAIDKANLALAKGTDVFDMDKIQLNAAMLNQAEQLSKVNNQAQLLGITNDIARLRIKQDILNLEDAIASKDTARIEAATKQLNEDLKILGTLQNQNIKLADIKSILDKIAPKDLINLANLDAAIAKLNAMSSMTGQPKISGAGTATSGVSPSGIPVGDFVPKIPTSGVSMNAILEFSDAATERANAMAALMEAQNAADAASFANSSLYKFDVTINTGVGDPNAIAETLDQYLQGAVDRGTLRLR